MNIQSAISAAWNKIGGLTESLIVMLPNIILALVVFIAFFFVARWLKLVVKRLTRKHRQARNLGMALTCLIPLGKYYFTTKPNKPMAFAKRVRSTLAPFNVKDGPQVIKKFPNHAVSALRSGI